MHKNKKRYAVIGAGHGGRTMAAHLALMGFEVSLYNRTFKRIALIKEIGGIHLESQAEGPKGFGRLACVTSDMQEALHNSDIIMVVVPAFAHADIARKAAPYLKDGQIVILNPGRTLGSLAFRRVLKASNCEADIVVAETQTFLYASRMEGHTQARIFRIKDAVPLAALPSSDTNNVLEALKPAYPQFVDGGNIMETGLNNIGGIFHPVISLLNTGRIEATGDFQFYVEGVTPTIARIMETLDRERVNVAAALGFRATTALEWLKMTYGVTGNNLIEAIHNQTSYQGINAPQTLDHRYFHEDIPMSLVPIASLGHRFGVSVRGIESMIQMSIIANKTDYWVHGRTVESLGVKHLTRKELMRFVNGRFQEKEIIPLLSDRIYLPGQQIIKKRNGAKIIEGVHNKQTSSGEIFIG